MRTIKKLVQSSELFIFTFYLLFQCIHLFKAASLPFIGLQTFLIREISRKYMFIKVDVGKNLCRQVYNSFKGGHRPGPGEEQTIPLGRAEYRTF